MLTAELARRADKVVCIEIDSRLLPVLDETLAEFDNIKIVNEDVLKVDLHKLIEQEFAGMPVAVCANLPYYITSPIIMNLLEAHLPIASLTVMVQKEAAARLCAEPGSREVGAVSIAVRYYSDPKILFRFRAGLFCPRRMWTPPSSVWMCATIRRWRWAARSSFLRWCARPSRSAERRCRTPFRRG